MQTLGKEERIHKKIVFDALFSEGKHFNVYPFRIVWTPSIFVTPKPAQAAFVVPKKIFKLAVRRNLLRRRTKEVYRKNKQELYSFLETNNIQVQFIIIYFAKNIMTYQQIEPKLIKAISILQKEIQEYLDENNTHKSEEL